MARVFPEMAIFSLLGVQPPDIRQTVAGIYAEKQSSNQYALFDAFHDGYLKIFRQRKRPWEWLFLRSL